MAIGPFDERPALHAAPAGSAPAVTRAAAILDVLAAAAGQAVPLSDVARALGLPKSSTANVLAALDEAGLISRSGQGFTLGRKLVELGGRYLASVDTIGEFYAMCRELPYLGRETSRVAVLDGLEVLYLARYDGAQAIRLTASIGDRFPATCTATGKALLAALDPAVARDRVDRAGPLPMLTPRSLRSSGELLEQLQQVRERGYAVDDEEVTPGVLCLAMTVEGAVPHRPVCAVSATVLKARLDDQLREGLLVDLRRVVQALHQVSVPLGLAGPGRAGSDSSLTS